jgi:hypothetical protein
MVSSTLLYWVMAPVMYKSIPPSLENDNEKA